MPTFRVCAFGEWLYAVVVEADDLAEAHDKLAAQIRSGRLKPIQGPGITRSDISRIVAQPAGPEPR